MIKILYYLRAINIGGAETFIYNVLEKIDVSQYHVDIVLQSRNNNNIRLLDLCKKKGVKLYYTEPFERNYFKSYRQLLDICRENDYGVIHLHANSLINNIPILVARKLKCKLVIHSHNSNNNIGGGFGKIIHYINRLLIREKSIVLLSCSDKAGKWMFGSKSYQIISNGINLNTYNFNEPSRASLRNNFGIKDSDIVWGHVSRFVEAKNHTFLIRCFNYYNEQHLNCKLVLLGDGPLYEEIKNSTTNKNILFLGNISDTSMYYSLFDVMVFPSLFEGLPFTLVEAQASGLPILASDNITKLVNVTGLITYMSLNKTVAEWCSNIPKLLSYRERLEASEKMKNSAFDSNVTVNQLCTIYHQNEI